MQWKKTIILILVTLMLAQAINALEKRTLTQLDVDSKIDGVSLNTSKDKFKVWASTSCPFGLSYGYEISNGQLKPSFNFDIVNDSQVNSIGNQSCTISVFVDFGRVLKDECQNESCFHEINNEYIDVGPGLGYSPKLSCTLDNPPIGGRLKNLPVTLTSRKTNGNIATWNYSVEFSGTLNKGATGECSDPVTPVTTCQTSSTQNHEVLDLQNDLQCANWAIIMTHRNVTLDCHGFIINFSRTSLAVGVNVSGSNFSSVRNCILTGNAATSTGIGAFTGTHNFTIFNNSIDLVTGTGSAGVSFTNANNGTLTYNNINSSGNGLSFTLGKTGWDICHNDLIQARSSGTNAISGDTTGFSFSRICNNTLVNSGSGSPVALSLTTNLTIEDNYIVGTAAGLVSLMSFSATTAHRNNIVRRNIFNSTVISYRGLSIGGSTGIAFNNTISNNQFHMNSSSNRCLQVMAGAINTTVSNNLFDCAGIAINMNGSGNIRGMVNNTFSNNTIEECSVVDGVVSSCNADQILLSSNASNINFIDNSFNKSRIGFSIRVESLPIEINNITLMWALNLNVTNSTNGNAVNNVQVNINNSLNQNLSYNTTNSLGYINSIVATELILRGNVPQIYDNIGCYNITNVNLTCYTPFNISAFTNDKSTNLTYYFNYTSNITMVLPITPGVFAETEFINNTLPRQGDVVNVTANLSDFSTLSACHFFDNQSLDNGAYTILNKTVIGLTDQCSQNYTIRLAAGNVINFSVVAEDFLTNTIFSNITVTVQAAAAANSCTYSSGVWQIQGSDNCKITTDTSTNGNDIECIGPGNLTVDALITKGSGAFYNRCNFNCYRNLGCFG